MNFKRQLRVYSHLEIRYLPYSVKTVHYMYTVLIESPISA